MGVEDALAIATALEVAWGEVGGGGVGIGVGRAVTEALQAASKVRLGRTQWMTQSLREMGEIYQVCFSFSITYSSRQQDRPKTVLGGRLRGY